MINLVVMGPNEFDRACMVASLTGASEFRAEACADPAAHAGPEPNVLLLEDGEDGPGSPGLGERLRELGARWPAAKIIILTSGSGERMELCRRCGVRAYLPMRADLDVVVAAIRLAGAGLIVYPESMLPVIGSPVGVSRKPVDQALLNGIAPHDREHGTSEDH